MQYIIKAPKAEGGERIIPMHGLINVRRYHMARCSVYIKKCIEPSRKELKWEKTVGKIDFKFKERYLRRNKLMKFSRCIVGVGTVIIALNAIVSYAFRSISIAKEFVCCSIMDLFGGFLALILFIVICWLAKDYVDYDNICNSYEQIIDEIDNENSHIING